jgi:hypothetical protein
MYVAQSSTSDGQYRHVWSDDRLLNRDCDPVRVAENITHN